MRGMLLAALAGTHLMAGCGDAPAAEITRQAGAAAAVGAPAAAVSRSTTSDGVPLTIYDVPTAMYTARFTGEGALRHLNLTAWRLKDGSGTQTTLWLEIGETSHRIATLARGERFGRAATEVRLAGAGGSIVVEGVDGAGTPIGLTATCATFVKNTEDNG